METKVKNREWVKNAAIIFLAVLLVLTFFSNTIMNRSLPEVATEYVRSNTITAKVRGTGTVESQGVYEVKASETREIRAVMVKSGQKVETGDVLFVLGEGDSAEIEAAQERLRQLKLNYQQTVAGAMNYSGQLSRAQTRYNNAVAAEAAAYAALNGNVDFQNSLTALNAAKDKLASAELNYKLANDTALQSLASASAAFSDFEDACLLQGVSFDLTLDSPYNTYTHYGLPPGPICNPGMKSIKAALEPKLIIGNGEGPGSEVGHKAYFFATNIDGNNEFYYSEDEFNKFINGPRFIGNKTDEGDD